MAHYCSKFSRVRPSRSHLIKAPYHLHQDQRRDPRAYGMYGHRRLSRLLALRLREIKKRIFCVFFATTEQTNVHDKCEPTNFHSSVNAGCESMRADSLVFHHILVKSVTMRRHAIAHSCDGYVLRSTICQIRLSFRARIGVGISLFMVDIISAGNFDFWC